MTNATDSIALALEYLDAIELAPGRYGYRSESTVPHWVTFTSAQLNYSKRQPGVEEEPPFSCYVFRAVHLPRWWTPERRFAVTRPRAITQHTFSELEAARKARSAAIAASYGILGGHDGYKVVTVDLETGAEVPA